MAYVGESKILFSVQLNGLTNLEKEYTNIVYNDNDTITLTDKDGINYTMECVYDNGKLIGVTYEGQTIPLKYEDDVLLSIDGMSVDLNNAPATSGTDTRLKELVEGTLTELVDDTITTVGSYCFYYSTLQKVDLQNCTSVGLYGFYTSTKLTNVNLPNCTTVGNFTFYDCETLARIDLGSITSIGTKAFYNCKALTTLIIRTNQVAKMTDTTYMLSNTPISSGRGYIYVPDNLVEAYKSASGWATYKNQIKGLSELEVASNE